MQMCKTGDADTHDDFGHLDLQEFQRRGNGRCLEFLATNWMIYVFGSEDR